MRILVDMNLSPQWRSALEKHGHSCIHWSEVGGAGASDEAVMRWALENGFIILTHDLDFGAILAATRAHGIQVRTQDVLPSAMETILTGALERHEAELAAGALVVIDEARSRVRVLPFFT